MALVEKLLKPGSLAGGGCWWCGQVPNVGLKPGHKERRPSSPFKWLPVGSDLLVLLPKILKDRSGRFSSGSPRSHFYSSPSHSHSGSVGHSQNSEAGGGFRCWRGSWGEKSTTLCGEEEKADPGTYGPRLCCQMRWRECVFCKYVLEGCKIGVPMEGKKVVRGERGWRKPQLPLKQVFAEPGHLSIFKLILK